MSHKIIRVGLILCVLLCGSAARTRAQPNMTPEKRALIKQLLDATNDPKTAQVVMNMMHSQAETSSQKLMIDIISERDDLDSREKDALRQKLLASTARMTKRFRELMAQRIDLTKILEAISYSLYDKYFTEAEIKDLIAFYRSPTGKKSIEVMPKLFDDSMTRASAELTSKLRQIMKEITDEEIHSSGTTPRPSGQ